MDTPTRTTNIPAVSALDEVLGNVTIDGVERTRRQSVNNLALQLVGTGPIAKALVAFAQSYVIGTSWVDISTNAVKAGTYEGQPGRVSTADTGTHTGKYLTIPAGTIATGVINNAGEYVRGATASDWIRTGDVIDTTGLQEAIDAEEAARIAGDAAITTGLQDAIDAEEAARIAGDAAVTTGLQEAIDAEEAARIAGDAAVTTGLQEAIDAEEAARIAGDAGRADGTLVDETDSGSMIPLLAAEHGVAAWLDQEGAFNVEKIGKHVKLPNVMQVVPTDAKIPLLANSKGQVTLWLEADGLHGRGLVPGISVSDALSMFSPRLSAGTIPAATDGRTLTRARRKAAQVRAGGTEPLRVAMLGDSWCQGNQIPTAMTEYLASIFGDCGKSWIHAAPTGHWAGVSVTASAGWAFLDADTASSWPYGVSPDGQMGWTDQATDTLAIVTPSCTEARIYTRSHGGTWRYRVDGGSWTTVTETTGGALTTTVITGLSAASHTIDIDTTGNAGVVAWCGMDTRTTGASAEVIKLGNGGLTGHDMRTYINNTGDIWADLDPDLVVVILGTNDYVYADSTVQEFSAALAEIVSTVSATVDGVGFAFVAPALSPTTAIVPLSEYRDAMYSQALALGADYLSAYDLIAPYADDPSIWTDSRHLNQTGGDVMVRLINTKLMGI